MRKFALPLMLSVSMLTTIASVQADESQGALNIAVIGDTPYGLKDSDIALDVEKAQ